MADEWEGGTIETAPGLAGWRARGRAPARPHAAAPAPKPRAFVARLFGWLVAFGLVASVALLLPVETSSVLAAPGGVLTAVGRVAAMAGTLPAARHAAAHRPYPGHRERPRPGPSGALASQPRALGPRPHRYARRGRHLGLRAAGAHRRPARAVAHGHDVPRDADGGRRLRAAAPGRPHVVSLRPPPDALRDVVGGAPLHLSGRGAVVRPPAVDTAPPSWDTRWRAPTGSPCGSSRPAQCSATVGGCRSCAACGTG